MTSLLVLSSGVDRSRLHGHYVIFASPDLIRSEQIGKFAVVFHDVAHNGLVRTLRAPCRVLPSAAIGPNEVRADQTIRNAIGIPFEYDPQNHPVRLAPLTISWRLRSFSWLSRRLRVRELFFRVAKSDPPDMEKELIRVPQDAFGLLGVGVGDRVVLESTFEASGRWRLVRVSMPAYPLTEEICRRREDLERNALDARYPDAASLLEVEPDIGAAFLDAWARSRLGIEPLDAVRARRDVWNGFLRELREFGIIFGLTLFGLASVLPNLAAAIIAPLFALVLTLVNIRASSGSPRSS